MKWLNKESREFLSRGYLLGGVTPEQRIRQIADKAEEILDEKGFSDKFYSYMEKGWYSLATPIWLNFGLDRGLPISCYGIDIQDDTYDILRANAEIGAFTKNAGGTAGYFGKLRPRGAKIRNNGVSNGSVSFMQPFQTTSNVITQGQARRGYFAAYTDADHGDVEEFLECREEGSIIQDISLGLCFSDEFMKEALKGDKRRTTNLARFHKKRFESGFPYAYFTDNVNRQRPQVYKDKGMFLKTSQMCVTGNQRVVTSKGLKTAKDLFLLKKPLILFDNNTQVGSSEMKLIEKDVSVFKIVLDNGLTHTVTDYHKVSVRVKNKKDINVMCRDLSIGDKVNIQTNAGMFGNKEYKNEAFLLGLYQSDGTQNKKSKHFDIWENDFDIIEEIESGIKNLYSKYNYTPRYKNKGEKFIECNTGVSNVRKQRLTTQLFNKAALDFEKGCVPEWIFESSEETVWEYLRGLFIADGTAYLADKKTGSIKVEYTDINRQFLEELQLLMNNLGLNTSINLLRKGGVSLLPNGKGGNSKYKTKDCFRLTINNRKSQKLFDNKTGFISRKNINVHTLTEGKNSRKSARVVSITLIGREDVYCVTVDNDIHHWVCNGVITHNCTEIMEYVDEDVSFVCCLSSQNMLYFDDWKGTDVTEVLTKFLYTVYEDFIEKAKNIPFMEKAVKFAREHKSIGVGLLGLHSYLQSKMIAFESLEAKMISSKAAKHLNEHTLIVSKELAKRFGEPKLLKGYGEMFTTRCAIAPTTSSSFILEQVSPSIELLQSNYFIKDLAKGKYTYRNPYLKKLLEEKGKDTIEIWRSILKKGGSVQHLNFLSEHEKKVFKTFGEVSQLEIIQNAAAMQSHIDQGISLNLMVHPDTSLGEVNRLFYTAWELGLKTLYYQRSANLAQEVSRDLMECESCSG
jgi:ribonucleoside-diphosphate reductase alpha chain